MSSLPRFMALLTVLCLLGMTFGQGFYSTRYGKRNEGYVGEDSFNSDDGTSLHTSRYGRSSAMPRSSRFIGGSRYGKRDSSTQKLQNTMTDLVTATLNADSFSCYLVNLPNLYRCQRKSLEEPSQESTN